MGVRSEAGTASVELVAVLPLLLVIVLVAAQIAMIGQALWSSALAARAGARASLVGRDAAGAARGALPPVLRTGAKVKARRVVRVGVRVPRLLRGTPGYQVQARTRLGPPRG